MFESRDRVSEDQQEFWVETRRLPKATASTFYRKLDDTLNEIGFIEGVRSKSGKALLRKRGEHLERSFCHVLDHGGLRRATLRGEENLTKRQLGAALTYNLSLLMRHLTGTGTPKQWLAGVGRLLAGIFSRLRAIITIWRARIGPLDRTMNHWFSKCLEMRKPHTNLLQLKLSRFSTGC